MRYHKLMEKAKLERAKLKRGEVPHSWTGTALKAHADPEEAPQAAYKGETPNKTDDRAATMETISPSEWVPPVYTHSRRVAPDAALAAENCLLCLTPDAPEQEYYKVLRTQLMQRMKPKGGNTVMITSAVPGEGKSLTSINLAAAVAKNFNQTSLLVDCDLRRQSICRYMGLPGDKGIVDYLLGDHELKDLIIWPEIEKMTLISGGREVMNSAELLGSPRMRELMAEIKGRYQDRFIILDAPPILSGADTMVLEPYVDGIVVVVESGKTPFKEIQSAMERVSRDKFMGFVLNKHPGSDNTYYTYYNKR